MLNGATITAAPLSVGRPDIIQAAQSATIGDHRHWPLARWFTFIPLMTGGLTKALIGDDMRG